MGTRSLVQVQRVSLFHILIQIHFLSVMKRPFLDILILIKFENDVLLYVKQAHMTCSVSIVSTSPLSSSSFDNTDAIYCIVFISSMCIFSVYVFIIQYTG